MSHLIPHSCLQVFPLVLLLLPPATLCANIKRPVAKPQIWEASLVRVARAGQGLQGRLGLPPPRVARGYQGLRTWHRVCTKQVCNTQYFICIMTRGGLYG